MNANMVLMMEVNGVTYFWTGYRWSEEYPDAKLYAVLKELRRDRNRFPGACAVRDYGLDSERCVLSS